METVSTAAAAETFTDTSRAEPETADIAESTSITVAPRTEKTVFGPRAVS